MSLSFVLIAPYLITTLGLWLVEIILNTILFCFSKSVSVRFKVAKTVLPIIVIVNNLLILENLSLLIEPSFLKSIVLFTNIGLSASLGFGILFLITFWWEKLFDLIPKVLLPILSIATFLAMPIYIVLINLNLLSNYFLYLGWLLVPSILVSIITSILLLWITTASIERH